ncbi:carboxypeptidase regulatory-like domain-containing protein [Chryseosolibacter indicus]|uniref:Carboxypeptidase regulatory-like domain-containing protein n=1 Tax=Chryseosolibacter indicus TaxID=2782351 RepID=A0ABS5VK46_9BACT|nr:carboxypeptidase regulatory-like domain-containing protein [Chryseosolibacter indicus]
MSYKRVLIIFLFFTQAVTAQEIVQSVNGRVVDRVSNGSLVGASVKIIKGDKIYSTTTLESGSFSIQVPVGRYRINVTFTGYTSFTEELLVVSGKELTLNIPLSVSETVLEVVEVQGVGAVENIPGLQSLSIEKTLRVPANFFDPVRVITAYPGVVAANDQNNSIIVRGNSPNGLLWRLNGLDIVNPNHLANAGTFSDRPAANGGGVNILSAQMLDRTDFFFGGIPANYGNSLSGIIDMKLREGNKTRKQYTAQASLIGIDLAAEGPLGKSSQNSFLVNYRYSTVGLLSALGIDFGDEAINFQDISFHTSFEQKNGGTLTLFGFGGKSRNKFRAKDLADREEDKDKYDIDYDATTYAIGTNYKVPIGKGTFGIGAAYSGTNQTREANIADNIADDERNLLKDYFDSDNSILSTSISYNFQTGSKSIFELGVMTNYTQNTLVSKKEIGCISCSFRMFRNNEGATEGVLLQPYINFKTPINSFVDLTAGLRYLYYTMNSTSSVEPRVSLSYKTTETSGFVLAYSLISQLQQAQVYAAGGNKGLGFTKSHHADFEYWRSFSADVKIRSSLFYQRLFDVPVEKNVTSSFSVLNLIEAIAPEGLVNDGQGENYGVDLTVEKYFFNRNYIQAGASYYESRYRGSDGIIRDTRFNGNYTLNVVFGTEWNKPSRNRTIGLSSRLLYLGGLRESSIDVANSMVAYETVYDQVSPFNNKLSDYFRIDLRISFRKDKPGYTRTLAIDLQNVLNNENEGYHYYDFTQQKIVTKYQLGIIPVLVYRIDF